MTRTIYLNSAILTILMFELIKGANIAFLSLPVYSHLKPIVKTANELSKLGHNSYILSPETYRTKLEPVENGVKFIIVEEFQEWLQFKNSTLKFYSPTREISIGELNRATENLCDRYLLSEELFQRLKSLNISLAIVPADDSGICFSVFAYKLKIPFMVFGLLLQLYWHRTPWGPPVFPNRLLTFTDKMTLFQKLENLYTITFDLIYPFGIPRQNLKVYAPNRPDIDFKDLMKQCELFIIGSDIYLDFPLPTLPNVKYIGGLATGPAMPLQGKILEFVNASKHGVIVVSSGAFITWPSSHIEKLTEVFSRIKYDVVWKHSNSTFSRKNILLTKWLPQNDLLGHKNTKLFITHCGNSGQYESLYHAVPMIGFPLYADQIYNSNRMQAKGYGIGMDTYKYSVEELLNNIEDVIKNPKYKKAISKFSHMFHSQKERPSEKAARHIDEISKYGGDHLKSVCQDLPLYEFLMLDILAVILLALFFITFLTVFILRKCCKRLCERRKYKIQ